VNSVCNFFKVIYVLFSGPIRIRRHGQQEQYHMEHGFLFKAALSSVPPVQIHSSRHCR